MKLLENKLNPNYNLITDYEKLWELVNKGIKVIAYVDKNFYFKQEPNFQICEVFNSNSDGYRFEFRTLGCLFTCGTTEEYFFKRCNDYNLHYLEPQIQSEFKIGDENI